MLAEAIATSWDTLAGSSRLRVRRFHQWKSLRTEYSGHSLRERGPYALQGQSVTELGGTADDILLHMAFDSTDIDLAVAMNQKSQVLSSTDGGKSWSPLAP